MARRVTDFAGAILAACLAIAALTQGAVAAGTPSISTLSMLMMTSERVYNHTMSGFAVDGYDVVAYFIEGKPRPGSAEFETIWNGTAWRFSSRANQVAFERDPAVYAPRFGGYDAEAAVRGAASEADPAFFLILNGRLYLFRTAAGLAAYRDNAAELNQAESGWKEVERQLVGR